MTKSEFVQAGSGLCGRLCRPGTRACIVDDTNCKESRLVRGDTHVYVQLRHQHGTHGAKVLLHAGDSSSILGGTSSQQPEAMAQCFRLPESTMGVVGRERKHLM